MVLITYSPGALADIERMVDFLLVADAGAAGKTTELVARAVDVLKEHPLIGRPSEGGMRELVISRGRSGYLVLYRHDEARDRITVLGIRHQREAGYRSS